MARELVSAKLPSDQFSLFVQTCEHLGISRSEGISRAIDAWLESDPEPERYSPVDLDNKIKVLRSQIEELQHKVEAADLMIQFLGQRLPKVGIEQA